MSPRTAALIAQQMMLLRARKQQLTVAEQQVLRDVALRLEQVDEVLHACHDRSRTTPSAPRAPIPPETASASPTPCPQDTSCPTESDENIGLHHMPNRCGA